MMFTDPPYNIKMKATSKNRKLSEIENDSMDEEQFRVFILSFLRVAKCYVADEVYLCCDWRNDHIFKHCMKEVGWQVQCEIVWDKQTRAQNLNKWAFAHEFILYHGYFGAPTFDTNVWRVKREYSDVHLTPKPVQLIEKAIAATSGDLIYDAFSGTCSTLIACENLRRKCRAIEKDPKYVAVALERFYEHTGILPKLVK